MKKSIIIVIISILLGITLGVVIYKVTNNESKKQEIEKTEDIEKYVKEYLNDTLSDEVSVKALIVNKYISDTKIDECNIYNLDNNKVVLKETNCDKALEIAKKPIIEIKVNNGFKLNEWNNKDVELELSLKNGGNEYYKESDITNISWYSDNGQIDVIGNTFKYSNSINNNINIMVDFNDIIINYRFSLKIDKEKPIFEGAILNDRIEASYLDDYSVDKIYYYISLTKEENLSKDKFKELDDNNLKCDNTYYVWSYAIDEAGNESDIDYLGGFKKCESIKIYG